MAEGVEKRVRESARDKIECEVEICEGEISEKEGYELVKKFNMQKDFAH